MRSESAAGNCCFGDHLRGRRYQGDRKYARGVALPNGATGKARMVVMERHWDRTENALRNMKDKLLVEIAARGILRGEEIVPRLASCDVLPLVRGEISSWRGSTIAGIASGLPIAALKGPETASPITGVGVVFADPKRDRGIGEGLLNVLSDAEYRDVLSERSRRSQAKYFAWRSFAGALQRHCPPWTEL